MGEYGGCLYWGKFYMLMVEMMCDCYLWFDDFFVLCDWMDLDCCFGNCYFEWVFGV